MEMALDPMSGFGIKISLLKTVITENLSYKNAEDIYNYLNEFLWRFSIKLLHWLEH